MALRYKLPSWVGDVKPKENLVVPPFLRRADVVEFRRGANIKRVAEEVNSFVNVKVNAAVGAGKSSLLPKELALGRKALVFHVLPNPVAAADSYKYVSKQADALGGYPNLELLPDDGVVTIKIGVSFVSSAQMYGLMLVNGGLSKFQNCLVFLDEAHESDAFTNEVRNLSLAMGAGALVQASATFSGAGFRVRESLGSVEVHKYPPEDVPEGWSPSDKTRPWGFAQIRDNILVYTDSRTQYKHLAKTYGESGFLVHRLEAGMDQLAYEQAMSDLRDPRGPLVMLVADYSFRSTFTFNVGTIIDTGRVSYIDPRPGVLLKRSRNIFQFEAEQTAGRGGRTEGLVTKYYRPDVALDPVMCDLEGVEQEAAAYLHRLLGFKPVRELSSAVMAGLDLPVGMSPFTAVNGSYPLSYYVTDSKGVTRASAREAVVNLEVKAEAVTPVPPEYGSAEATGVTSDDEPEPSLVGGSTASDSGSDAEESGDGGIGNRLWNAILSSGDDVRAVVGKGYPCSVRGHGDARPPSVVFPRGLDSVLRLISGGRSSSIDLLSVRDRAVAMLLVTERYNVCAVEVLAASQALMGNCETVVTCCRGSRAARRYFIEVVEAVASYDAERDALYEVMMRLETDVLFVEELKGADEYVDKRAGSYVTEFNTVFRTPVYDDAHVRLQLGEALRAMPEGSGAAHRHVGAAGPGAHVRYLREVQSGRRRDSSGRDSGGQVRVRFDDEEPRVLELRAPRDRGSRGSYERDRMDSVSLKQGKYLVVKPPRWLGVKDVTYSASKNGVVSGAVVRPGKFLRKFAGLDKEYSY